MEMAVESMEMALGAIPRHAGTETYVPRTSSLMAAALQNFSWMYAD
jgi:hypothetical protein